MFNINLKKLSLSQLEDLKDIHLEVIVSVQNLFDSKYLSKHDFLAWRKVRQKSSDALDRIVQEISNRMWSL
ncbi:MAG: hypothetical protein ACO2ZP_00535 [Bacteriovoracaceae bacterium]